MNFNILYSREVPDFTHSIFSKTYSAVVITYLTSQPKQAESWQIKGACTHNDKTEAGSDSGAGCNVNKWVFSHAAGPAKHRARIELDKPRAGPAAS